MDSAGARSVTLDLRVERYPFHHPFRISGHVFTETDLLVVELDDGQGDPGLPLGIACFMGFVDIVRELAKRGAKVNLPDNSVQTSPLKENTPFNNWLLVARRV